MREFSPQRGKCLLSQLVSSFLYFTLNMATTLHRSDPKLSAALLRNYSYISSDSIQDCLSGTPLIVEGEEYDISSQSLLTNANFKPLLCCALNACCQHKFMLADRILTAINACFIVSPKLYSTLADEEFINNMEVDRYKSLNIDTRS